MEIPSGSNDIEKISKGLKAKISIFLLTMLSLIGSPKEAYAQSSESFPVTEEIATDLLNNLIIKYYSEPQTGELLEDEEYLKLLKKIKVDLNDKIVKIWLQKEKNLSLLIKNKEIISKLIRNEKIQSFFTALHHENPFSSLEYLDNLNELLKNKEYYMEDMAELYNATQRMAAHAYGTQYKSTLIDPETDKKVIVSIIKNYDYLLLEHYLSLDFSTSRILKSIINNQVVSIREKIKKGEITAYDLIKPEFSQEQAILGFAMKFPQHKNLISSIYDKLIIPFSEKGSSLCYISTTNAGLRNYLCSLQDSYLKHAKHNNEIPSVEQHYFVHITKNMLQEDFAYHLANLIDNAINQTDQKHITLLLNGFSHKDYTTSNRTSELLFDVEHQGFHKNKDFGITKPNKSTIENICTYSDEIDENTIKVGIKKGRLRIRTKTGRIITVVTGKTPIDIDADSKNVGENNTEGVGSVKILEQTIKKVKPTIVLAIGETYINKIQETGSTYNSEMRIEGLGHNKPSIYYHTGLESNNIPEYFNSYGNNESILQLIEQQKNTHK